MQDYDRVILCSLGERKHEISAGRGNTITLDQEWLDLLHTLWHEVKHGRHPSTDGQKVSLQEFGKILARKVGRRDPWSKQTLSKFLKGEQVTDDLVFAFSEFFGIPYPLISAPNPDIVEWAELGRYLQKNEPASFKVLRDNARARVAAAKELASIEDT